MKSLLLLALALLPSLTLAGGSVAWTDVQPVLARNPALSKLVTENFKVAETGWAVRLGRHFPELGGLRIAPYQFQVTTGDGTKLYLTIRCDQKFLLANGEVAGEDEIFHAVKVEETPVDLSISTTAPQDE